jgi:5-methylcytosine-specific restriction endonuclease McrA
LKFPKRREVPKHGTHVSKRDLDVLCRDVVFARDGYRCLRCGSTRQLQWCHVYSRRFLSLRWEPDNSFCGCAGCHLWWHHRPAQAVPWYMKKIGPERADALQIRAGTSGRAPDFFAVKMMLLKTLATMGGLGSVREGL